jgi:outer membrane protein assembly factor BamB
MLRHAICILVAVAFQIYVAASEPGGYWPQWRGPNRDNVSVDTGLLSEWPAKGPPLRWSVKGIGDGIAAVAVSDGRVIVLGDVDGEEYVTALDERTGHRLWVVPIGDAAGQSPLMRWLSQRTPTLEHDRLYAITAHGQLVCLATENGGELWRRDYQDDFGGGRRIWGCCDYPLVDGDRLICFPLGPQVGIVALDKLTGKAMWHSPAGPKTRSMYGAVILTEFDGTRQFVAALDDGIGGWSARDGSPLWWFSAPEKSFTSTHTPLLMSDESVIYPFSYGKGFGRLVPYRTGDSWKVKTEYLRETGIDPFQDGAVCVGDHFYTRTFRPGALTSIQWRTGETAWSEEPANPKHATSGRNPQSSAGRGSRLNSFHAGRIGLTWAEGHLYCLSSDGALRLVEATPTQYVEKSMFRIPNYQPALGATLPVVTAGSLYIRDNDRLLCFDVRRVAGHPPQEYAPIILAKPDRAVRSAESRAPKPIYLPTPQDVVDKMLDLAVVGKDDLLVDLGSGDGRIVITAAEAYGCRAVGYEIDSDLVRESRDRAEAKGLVNLVTIHEENMFTADLSHVDVVAVYFYPSVLEKMKPQFEQMKRGARIVSHFFEIPGVEPDRRLIAPSSTSGEEHEILLYSIPFKSKAKPTRR